MKPKDKQDYLEEYEVFKKKGKPFFPYAVLKDSTMALIVVAVIIAMSLILGAEQGPKADPTTTTYVPRPEWYFFFLFEVLRVIKPPELVPIATIIIPTICMVLLLCLPFYDQGPERRPERPLSFRSGTLPPPPSPFHLNMTSNAMCHGTNRAKLNGSSKNPCLKRSAAANARKATAASSIAGDTAVRIFSCKPRAPPNCMSIRTASKNAPIKPANGEITSAATGTSKVCALAVFSTKRITMSHAAAQARYMEISSLTEERTVSFLSADRAVTMSAIVRQNAGPRGGNVSILPIPTGSGT